MAKDEFDFQQQIEHAVADRSHKRVTITLLSGDKYTIGLRSNLTFFARMALLLKDDGGEAYFPFEAICNVDVTFLPE
jgi:hypothetical protein